MGRYGFGQPVRRREDGRFLTGSGRYLDDFSPPGLTHGVVLRSPHAHARLGRVAVDAARGAPGVLAVLTGEDVIEDGLGGIGIRGIPPGFGGPHAFWPVRPVLTRDRVRHVGDPVALVIAETAHQARDAAELIAVDYDILPAIVSPGAAVASGAPLVWDGARDNVGFVLQAGNAAEAEAAIARAAHVVRLALANNRLTANPIEPRGAIGEYDDVEGRYTLRSSTQTPHRVREILADSVFGIPENDLRVVATDVGGGFGMKGPAYVEEALVLWAARRVGRPVKWIAERGESFTSDNHGRDQQWRGELALDSDGRILALRAEADFALGAYLVNTSHVSPGLGLAILPGAYHCPAFHAVVRGVFTNAPTTSPYRGAGQPEGIYMLERLIDRAAAEIGLAPEEIRRRNFIRPDAMPYRTPTGQRYDSGAFESAMDAALDLSDHAGFTARRNETESLGRLRGLGICYFIEICGLHADRMEIRFDPSGAATILAGTFSHGQGHETIFTQLVADWLGVPMESIRFVQGDTDRIAYGRGTYASRSASIGGAALRRAADEVIDRGRRIAAHLLEAAEDDMDFAEGAFTVTGTDRAVSMTDVARAAHAAMGLPPALGVGLEGLGTFAPEASTYPNGCHVCEVEIDPDTGRVGIARYSAVDDVGRAVNPLLLAGQVHGGVAQGVGQALLEKIVMDEASGQILSASFLDYAMPRADDLPSIGFGHSDVPCATNPLGVKGAGEAGAVGAPPAVINAILDALRPLGVTEIEMPATPERIWRAIRNAA